MRDASERDGLLSLAPSDDESDTGSDSGSAPTSLSLLGLTQAFWWCIVLELLCEFSVMILHVPMVSLLEQAICHRNFPQDQWATLSPDVCKVASVQRSLAEVRGWKAFFDTLSAVIVALPMGRIADRHGHRPVFAAIIVGMIMALSWTLYVGKFTAVLDLIMDSR